MIWRLTYCNKDGVEARLDIIRGASTPVEVIEGTATPFILNYKMDKSDKSGHVMSSSADISIFETPTFNIDNLKTSSETEIKVEHYINGVLDWSGFVIPDFFSKTIGTPSTVEMVASDRLGTLKSVTIEPTTATISVSDLFAACLSKTGLSLSLYTQLPFTSVAGAESILDTKVSTQRFSNTKNRSISCYDILKSLLVMTNSIIVQRKGQWAVINKFHLEQGGAPSIVKAFSDITVGGRKTIIPVASSVGVYQEFGGGRIHPLNYDYNLDLSGWTPMNGFVPLIKDKLVYFFDSGTGQPLDTTTTTKKYLVNNINNPVNSYLSSGDLIIPYGEGTSVNVKVNINAITGATPLFYPSGGAKVLYSVVAKKGTELKYLNSLGTFVESAEPYKLIISFPQNLLPVAITKASMFEGTLQVAEGELLSDYTIEIRMYAPPYAFTSLINEFGISFSVENEIAKGNIYKTTQGANYTKEHEIDTTIFGDYITVGLDGYFYPYLLDDTSSLLTSAGELTTRWTTPTDTNELPILQHVSRQKSRMFRVAHDLLSIGIDENSFDPLTLYQDCNSKKYVVVSASYDFLRSELRADIQQIAYDNTIQPRDYIYSYFGEGESGISSVGGISGGGTGTGGGGMTAEQIELLNTVAGYWTLDENGNLKTTYNAYSEQELSAYGLGSGGSSGGGIDLLQAWTDYDSTKDNWAVKAGLLVPFYNDTKSRLTALEGGAILSLNVTGTGNAIASLSKTGSTLLAVKGNFAELDANGKVLSSQLPSYVDDVLEYVNLAAFPATGETGKIYIAQDSNKTYRWSGTAYVEISASLALGETSSTAYRGDRGKTAYDHSQLTGNPHGTTFAQIVSRPTTITGYGITDAYTKTEVNSALTSKLDKSVFDDLFEKVEVSTGVFAIKAKYNFYGVGEISAYGLGTGGSGGGSYDRLDAWADYNSTKSGWVLSALLGVDLNTRVGNLEGGSALTVNTTGTGNAITSISKAGTVITATKGATFSLDGHTHSQYLTTITKAQVEGVLTGAITSHTHSYLPLAGGTLTGTLTANNHIILPRASHIYDTSTSGVGILVNDNVYVGIGDTKADTTRYIQLRGADVKFRETASGTEYGVWHAGNFTPGNYLPLSGGTMTNTNLVTNLNANYLAGQDGNYYNQRRYSDVTNYLGGYYTPSGLEKPNHAAFGAGKLKLAMLAGSNVGGISGIYVDTLWISGYTGGDVKYSTALHFDKYNQNIYFTKQNYDDTAWGTTYRFWTDANLSPVTTNTVQTITTQKTFSDGDANYGLNQKPSIILGANDSTKAGALKFWGNTIGAYGLIHMTTSAFMINSSQGNLYLQNSSTGNLYAVAGGGSVGIGNASPAYKLDVTGTGRFTSGLTANNLIISSTTAERNIAFMRPSYNYLITDAVGGSLHFITNGDPLALSNSILGLFNNGNVGIGKGYTGSNNPAVQLEVRGTIVATGEITAYVASDRRLKYNITPLFSSLDIIDKLNPVSYYWNQKAKELNPMKSDSLDYGLIAQEVEDVLPGVVHGIFDDKYKSIDYIKLIPIMIASIKELKQKVNKL